MGIDGGQSTAALTDIQKEKLYQEFEKMVSDIKTENYVPNIVYDGYIPVEFSSVRLSMYQDYQVEDKDEISKVLDEYYYKKSKVQESGRNQLICGKSTQLRLKEPARNMICS